MGRIPDELPQYQPAPWFLPLPLCSKTTRAETNKVLIMGECSSDCYLTLSQGLAVLTALQGTHSPDLYVKTRVSAFTANPYVS